MPDAAPAGHAGYRNFLNRGSTGESMKQNNTVVILALLGALALAALFGVLFSADNVVDAQQDCVPQITTNCSPYFSESSPTRAVDENTPPGTNIGAPVSAIDADGDTLTYSIEDGDDGALFAIDESTGQLITTSPLDHEGGNNSPTVSVEVTDPSDDPDGTRSRDSVSMTITVNDVDEHPLAPAPPTVTSIPTVNNDPSMTDPGLMVNWDAPDVAGGPTISGYEVQYKKVTDIDFVTPSITTNNSTFNTTITQQLVAGTSYHVRVRASNDEGSGEWSLVGTGVTNSLTNITPSFSTGSHTLTVPENTPPGQNIGAAIGASDSDSTTLEYGLQGADAGSFSIDTSSGQIMTKEPLDYEAPCGDDNNDAALDEEECSYSMLVKVVDGDGGSHVTSVTIDVTDDTSEAPAAPGRPTVTAYDNDRTADTDESTTTLKVTWEAPVNKGPSIKGTGTSIYTVGYREGTTGAFTEADANDVDGTTATIDTLNSGKSHEVRVKAHNGEGESPWSPTGTGSTNPANRAPEFSGETADRSVRENTRANMSIGRPISATDRDGDTLEYSLFDDPNDDADDDPETTFDINESTGQIVTKGALNFEGECGDNNNDAVADESECTYKVTVKAEDGRGDEDTIKVTIGVGDDGEAPAAPDKPTVKSGTDDTRTTGADESTTTLIVSWDPTDNMGPSITRYEVQYRSRGSFTPVTDSIGTNTSVTITGLSVGIAYDVQVRATNDEGTGGWSTSGRGSTNAADNDLPVFQQADNPPFRLIINENTPAGTNIGQPVTATDGDSDNDTLTYSLDGADRASFDIDTSNGQIKTKTGVTYNFEERETYDELMVKVEDNEGGSSTIEVVIAIVDLQGEAPVAPAAPTVRTRDDDPKTGTADESTSTLEVSWNEPSNDGPAIDRYDIRYKIKDSTTTYSEVACVKDNADTGECFEDRKTIISALEDGTTYEVQVKATATATLGDNNDATDSVSPWSDPGNGATVEANNRPEFSSGASATRTVAENTRSGQNVGAPLTATERDAERLTYTLEGPGADAFSIVASSGQIRTSGALNYEERSSYSLTVKADDGTGTRNSFAAISVTIMVTDVGEPPSRPAAPMVAGVRDSSTIVRVSWEAPANTGPDITDFDVQYRAGSSGNFKSHPHHGMDTSTIITDLNASTTYQVQVLANNAEGPSDWSPSGSGRPDPDPANNRPEFFGGARTIQVPENSGPGTDIGSPVAATDRDRDSLIYSLEGADAGSFDIVDTSGQIRTKEDVVYNYEGLKTTYRVRVKADDGRGGVNLVAVTIDVTDVDGEAPETPDAPTVAATAGSNRSLDVTWTAPENMGPDINDYDIQYRQGSSGSFTSWDHTGSATTAVITGLLADTSYEVQVMAKNEEGDSDWSALGIGATSPNNPPVFATTSTTRSVHETAAAGTAVGAPVTATDADNDTLTYTLGGSDAGYFEINDATGQILIRAGITLDAGTKPRHTVSVVASDGIDNASITVVIDVILNNAPAFAAATAERRVPQSAGPGTSIGDPLTATDADNDTLTYSLEGVDEASFDINDTNGQILTKAGVTLNADTKATYTVVVVASDGTDEARVTVTITIVRNVAPEFASTSTSTSVVENSATGTNVGAPVTATDADQGDTLTYTLGGVDADAFDIDDETGQIQTKEPLDEETKATYTVTVTANDGTVDSGPVTVTIFVTDVTFGCATEGAIADPSNTGLVRDCEELLEARDKLEGTGRLDWSVGTPITEWDGVYLGGTPPRVTRVIRRARGLTGTVPAELGAVEMLRELNLRTNRLTGTIPAALSDLRNLERLLLHDNMLSGQIPDLRDLRDLKMLWLSGKHMTLTGGVPAWLNGMTNLESVSLWGNNLSGPIPCLTGMTSLQLLKLQSNQLTGGVPSCLGDMSDSLRSLYIHLNPLEGTIPGELGRLTSLRRLWIHSSDLTGSIPPELGNMAGLWGLNLRDNDLTGSIPTALGDLSNMRKLRLHNNRLSGSIPTELGDLSNLTDLWLSGNELTGTIPSVLGGLDNLRQLSLKNNGLSGAIPSELGDLTDTLTHVFLAGNSGLTGCVPAGLADVTNNDIGDTGLNDCNGN